MRTLTILLAFNLIILSGCSRVPELRNHMYSGQEKLQAVHHWDIIAEDVAKQITKTFFSPVAQKEQAEGEAPVVKQIRPVYIAPPEDTSFGKSFHELLITQLVNAGVPVTQSTSDQALTLTCDVIGITHEANRNVGQPATIVGEVFKKSILVIRDVLTFGVFPENNIPHSEVAITVSIADANTYLMRNTFVYYINDDDFWHYEKSTPSIKKKITLTNQ